MSILPDSVREPLMRAAIIITVLASIGVFLVDPLIGLFVAFGMEFTPLQAGAIKTVLQALITALGTLGVAAAVHNKVTPTGAPVLREGTHVRVEGSNDQVVIEKTPPGPTAIEGPPVSPHDDAAGELRDGARG